MSNVNFTQRDIDSAHDAVQRVFQALARKIQERLPSVHAIFGKASNERFPLYSYVSFEDKHMPAVDPVVAAVDLRIDGTKLAVKTDLIGEETGQVYLEPITRTVLFEPNQTEWLASLTQLTQDLADRASPIVQRLFEHATPLKTSA